MTAQLDLTRKTPPIALTPVLRSILSYLATGWYPWGARDEMIEDAGVGVPFILERTADFSGRSRHLGFAMCCGHVIGPNLAKRLIAEGLLQDLPKVPFYGDWRLLGITDAGREWLRQNWHRRGKSA